MQAAVKIKNLSVVLGGRFKAIDDLSADLPAGKIIGFIGPSGAGKTTLVRSIVGRQKIAGGSIAVHGLPAGNADLRETVNYMPQELSVYPDLTVTENIRYFATMFGIKRKDLSKVVGDILQTTGMTDRAHQLVSRLSGGQKRRVSLAAALIGSPKLMILDEPTVGLDPVLREQIWELFKRQVATGTTIIITSHVMDEAERCDSLLLVRGGKLLAHGSPQELCKRTHSKNVEQSFLKLVQDAA